MLGNGFYNPHAKDVWYFEQSPWRDEPALLGSNCGSTTPTARAK